MLLQILHGSHQRSKMYKYPKKSFQILEHRLDIYIFSSWQSIKQLMLNVWCCLALACTNHTNLRQAHLPRPQITQTKRHLKLEAGGYLKCARKQSNSHNMCGTYMLVQESLNLLLNIKSCFYLDYILVCWLHLTSSHVIHNFGVRFLEVIFDIQLQNPTLET